MSGSPGGLIAHLEVTSMQGEVRSAATIDSKQTPFQNSVVLTQAAFPTDQVQIEVLLAVRMDSSQLVLHFFTELLRNCVFGFQDLL